MLRTMRVWGFVFVRELLLWAKCPGCRQWVKIPHPQADAACATCCSHG